MFFLKKQAQRLLLSALTCLFVVGLYSAFDRGVAAFWAPETASQPALEAVSGFSLGENLDEDLRYAQSQLLAQGATASAIMPYVAVMSEENVYPGTPETSARGAVGAALAGNQLVVRGSFRDLTSAMRDYAMDPVSPPNPNITSAFHIHQGMPTENGPFQYALDVTLDETNRSGNATGSYALTPEQLQALNNGQLYVDIHTTENRGGELRAILMPY